MRFWSSLFCKQPQLCPGMGILQPAQLSIPYGFQRTCVAGVCSVGPIDSWDFKEQSVSWAYRSYLA
jgi:hypothetical protein